MFLSQDYRSRGIGVVAALGVLITGVIVDGAASRAPKPALAPAPARMVVRKVDRLKAPPRSASRLDSRCDPFC